VKITLYFHSLELTGTVWTCAPSMSLPKH